MKLKTRNCLKGDTSHSYNNMYDGIFLLMLFVELMYIANIDNVLYKIRNVWFTTFLLLILIFALLINETSTVVYKMY